MKTKLQELFKPSYSFRRFFIDQELNQLSHSFKGNVLDLGGKKYKKRGRFQPPTEQANCWVYLNRDYAERPDIIADGKEIPLHSNLFDWIVCVEVLEFIAQPETMISEMGRVLRKGGKIVLTSPFLYRIHDRPNDLQRFTETKLKNLFSEPIFKIEFLKPQGFFFVVVADFAKSAIAQINPRFLRFLTYCLTLPLILFFCWLDTTSWVKKSEFFTSFTTGYMILIEKTLADKTRKQ